MTTSALAGPPDWKRQAPGRDSQDERLTEYAKTIDLSAMEASAAVRSRANIRQVGMLHISKNALSIAVFRCQAWSPVYPWRRRVSGAMHTALPITRLLGTAAWPIAVGTVENENRPAILHVAHYAIIAFWTRTPLSP